MRLKTCHYFQVDYIYWESSTEAKLIEEFEPCNGYIACLQLAKQDEGVR